MNPISQPSKEEWQIYREVKENHPVFKIAEKYSIDQERVLSVYFECLMWEEGEESVSHHRRRRRH